jgi:hypothetical protein
LVTDDIDGNARSTAMANGPVDIGADEYTPTGSASTSVDNAVPGDGITQTFTGVDGKTVGVILWSGPAATFPNSITFTYTPGKRAVNNSNVEISIGIDRMYTITPDVPGSGWTATVDLYYNPSTELRGLTESALRINRRPTSGDGAWTVESTTMNTTNHFGSFTASSLSTFSFDDGATPLPVQLVSFTAAGSRGGAELRWSTATETNNYGFEIERRSVSVGQTFLSVRSDEWLKVGFVPGAGTSTSPREYSYTDEGVAPGRYAYRIKQIDNGGAFQYFGAVEVEIGAMPNAFTLAQNYPNPFNPSTTISFTLAQNGHAALKVFDMLGREVMVLFDREAQAGQLYTATFDASRLATGVYIYTLESNGQRLIKRMNFVK